jgi:SLT domain-containing protein
MNKEEILKKLKELETNIENGGDVNYDELSKGFNEILETKDVKPSNPSDMMKEGFVDKAKKVAKGVFYGMPYAMKAGDEMLTTSQKDTSDGVGIHQNVQRNNLLKSLLNGEVTQEVEALRYEMYKTDEKANEYEHIGNGVAVKKKSSEVDVKKRVKSFTMENEEVVFGVTPDDIVNAGNLYDSGKEVSMRDLERDFDRPSEYLLKVKHSNPIQKFNLNELCNKIRLENGDDNCLIKLYFLNGGNGGKYKPLETFLKELNGILGRVDMLNTSAMSYIKDRYELIYGIDSISFTTRNASNDVPDGINYKLTGIVFDSIEFGEYNVLTFKAKNVEGGQLLSEKYYSKLGDERFKNKEKREGFVPTLGNTIDQKETSTRERIHDEEDDSVDDEGVDYAVGYDDEE